MEATVTIDPVEAQTPSALVTASLAGDRAAFARLVEPSLAPALGTSIVITRSHADAADAVQDALLAAWQGLDGLRDPVAFPAWFRTLVVRSAIRVARRRGSLVALEVVPDELESGDDQPGEALERLLAHRQLGRAFDRLSADDRALLTLRYLWDRPVGDVAAELGIVPGTVKSRTHAAMRRLRAAFDAEARR